MSINLFLFAPTQRHLWTDIRRFCRRLVVSSSKASRCLEAACEFALFAVTVSFSLFSTQNGDRLGAQFVE